MLTSALSRGADALIVDLEDAVPPARRRPLGRTWPDGCDRFPPDRPSTGDAGIEDARAVVCPALRGLCVAKANTPVVNEVFTPTAEEVAAARDLVSRFESAGGGVCLDARGRMVDLAVVREARRILRST
jgi:citrate lyase beta subunit